MLATEQAGVSSMMALGPKALPTMRRAIVAGQPPQAPLPLKPAQYPVIFLILVVISNPFLSWSLLCTLYSSIMARISSAIKRRVRSMPPMPITRFFTVISLRRPKSMLLVLKPKCRRDGEVIVAIQYHYLRIFRQSVDDILSRERQIQARS